MIAAPFGGTILDLKKKWKKEDFVAYLFVAKLIYPVVTVDSFSDIRTNFSGFPMCIGYQWFFKNIPNLWC